MRIVAQRVSRAKVTVGNKTIGEIGKGLLVFLAIHKNDEEKVITNLADKILTLRVFEDTQSKMNLSVRDTGGEILVVSQFTLYGDASGGNRPSFTAAAGPAKAEAFYDKFVTYLKEQRLNIRTGKFGADMAVELINDGPVTIILDV